MSDPKTFPIQAQTRDRKPACAPECVYMAAYEVYSHVFGPQDALLMGGCRGGFGSGELVAFLYAKSFPQSEWRKRVDEALHGLNID